MKDCSCRICNEVCIQTYDRMCDTCRREFGTRKTDMGGERIEIEID